QTLWPPSTSGNDIYSMDFHFHGLHYRAPGIRREHTDLGSRGPYHENVPLYPTSYKSLGSRPRPDIPSGNLETTRPPHRHRLRPRHQIHLQVLVGPHGSSGRQTKVIDSVSSRNRWSNGTGKSISRAIAKNVQQLRAKQWVGTAPHGRVRIQQLGHFSYR